MNKNDFSELMQLFGEAEKQVHTAQKEYLKDQKKVIKSIDEMLEMVEGIPTSD